MLSRSPEDGVHPESGPRPASQVPPRAEEGASWASLPATAISLLVSFPFSHPARCSPAQTGSPGAQTRFLEPKLWPRALQARGRGPGSGAGLKQLPAPGGLASLCLHLPFCSWFPIIANSPLPPGAPPCPRSLALSPPPARPGRGPARPALGSEPAGLPPCFTSQPPGAPWAASPPRPPQPPVGRGRWPSLGPLEELPARPAC